MSAYDPANIFAKILRGELPCHRVYEDEHTLAFMDIMPRAAGHLLVLPKAPARNILDVPPDALGHTIETVRRLATGVMKAFEADGVTIHQFNEDAGGQVVFHLHFHVIPRRAGETLRPPGGPMEKPEVLAGQAERVIAALGF
jgi:histidine triad (HIT) family protein